MKNKPWKFAFIAIILLIGCSTAVEQKRNKDNIEAADVFLFINNNPFDSSNVYYLTTDKQIGTDNKVYIKYIGSLNNTTFNGTDQAVLITETCKFLRKATKQDSIYLFNLIEKKTRQVKRIFNF